MSGAESPFTPANKKLLSRVPGCSSPGGKLLVSSLSSHEHFSFYCQHPCHALPEEAGLRHWSQRLPLLQISFGGEIQASLLASEWAITHDT